MCACVCVVCPRVSACVHVCARVSHIISLKCAPSHRGDVNMINCRGDGGTRATNQEKQTREERERGGKSKYKEAWIKKNTSAVIKFRDRISKKQHKVMEEPNSTFAKIGPVFCHDFSLALFCFFFF